MLYRVAKQSNWHAVEYLEFLTEEEAKECSAELKEHQYKTSIQWQCSVCKEWVSNSVSKCPCKNKREDLL